MANDSLRVGQLYAEFTTKGLTSVTNSMNILKGKVLNLKTAFLGLTSALGLGKLAKDLINTGAEFETYRKRLLAVTKDQKTANEVFERMSKWAAENPVDTDDAIAAFVRLKSAAVANTEEATTAVGNLAAMMGTSMQDAANALVTANARTLRYYGIQLSTAGKEAKIQIGGTVTTVKNGLNEIRQGIVSTVQKEYGSVMDMMKDTWEGNIKTMGGMWTEFKRQIAGDAGTGGPFDMVKIAVINIRKRWEAWMKDPLYPQFIKGVQDDISDILLGVMDLGIGSLKALGQIANVVSQYQGPAGYGLLGWVLFGPKGAAVGAFFGLLKQSLGESLTRELVRADVVKENEKELAGLKTAWDNATQASITYQNEHDKGFFKPYTAEEQKEIDRLGAVVDAAMQAYEKRSNELAASVNDEVERRMAGIKKETESTGEAFAHLSEKGVEALSRIRSEMVAARGKQSNVANLPSGSPAGGKSTSSSGSSKTTSAKDRLKAVQKIIQRMRDEVKYADASVSDFLPVLDQMLSRYPRMSEEWKAVKDLQLEGLEEVKTKAQESAQRIKETEDWRYQVGLASADEYFEQLKARYQASVDALTGFKGKQDSKEFDTLTEAMRQDYAALQAAADSALDRIREKLDSGAISMEQARAEAQGLIASLAEFDVKPSKALQNFADGIEQADIRLEQLRSLTRGWVEDFQNGIIDALVECKNFGDALTSLGKEIEKVALKWMLFGNRQTGDKGLLGGLFSFLPGMHSGGIVGSDAPTFLRRLPKYHTGGIVKAGEQLAVLKNGEGVFTPGQMKAIGEGMFGQPGNINIEINVDNSGNGDMTEEQANDLGKMIKEVVAVQVTEKLYDYKRRGFFRGPSPSY